jgi:hypothetical protein
MVLKLTTRQRRPPEFLESLLEYSVDFFVDAGTLSGDNLGGVSVEPDAVLALLEPYLPDLIGDVRAAFAEFDAILPLEYRLSIEEARPMTMSRRVLHLWRQRYGASGNSPIRVGVDGNRMEFLFVEGNEFCVGLRVKKLDDDGQSYQHVSQRQTALRQENCFPEFKMHVAHVFLGYRYTDGADEVVPALIDMSLSSERVRVNQRYGVRWRVVIWTAGEGMAPVPIQPPLFPPPPPVVRPRRRAEGDGQAAEGGGG